MRNGNHRLKTARAYLERAERELAEARPSMDDIGIRQAAEKAWAATREWAKAAFEMRGRKAPKGTTALQRALFDLTEHDPALRKMQAYERFSAALQTLHADCFGEGVYSVKVIERMIRRVMQYVEDVERLK